jgi:hypothetical protein
VLRHDERTHGRQRRRQGDLKATRNRHHAVSLEPRERPVRRDRRVGVAERFEPHLFGMAFVRQTHAGKRAPALRRRWHDLERRLGGEDRQLPHDPVGAGAGLAIREAPQAVADRGRDRPEDDLGARQRNAADEVNATREILRCGNHVLSL